MFVIHWCPFIKHSVMFVKFLKQPPLTELKPELISGLLETSKCVTFYSSSPKPVTFNVGIMDKMIKAKALFIFPLIG